MQISGGLDLDCWIRVFDVDAPVSQKEAVCRRNLYARRCRRPSSLGFVRDAQAGQGRGRAGRERGRGRGTKGSKACNSQDRREERQKSQGREAKRAAATAMGSVDGKCQSVRRENANSRWSAPIWTSFAPFRQRKSWGTLCKINWSTEPGGARECCRVGQAEGIQGQHRPSNETLDCRFQTGAGRGAKGTRHHAGEACAFIMITSAAVVVMSWRSSGWHWH